MGTDEVLIFKKETPFLLKSTIFQTLIIAAFGLLLIPKYGAVAAIFSLWMGSFTVLIASYLKRKYIYEFNFAENIVFPYVLAFHIIALLTYFSFNLEANILTILFVLTMTSHFVLMNKELLRSIVNNWVK